MMVTNNFGDTDRISIPGTDSTVKDTGGALPNP